MSSYLFLILFLAFLEGILSIDNALVLALLARGLPQNQQRKALTYGLVGAVIFRLISLLLITSLIKWRWMKIIGALYLLFISLKYFLKKDKSHEEKPPSRRNFWKVVLLIELTDIAFAVDSILAAVALTPKFWVVFVGGLLGVVMMRFAASVFISVLRRFPSFETTAYLLVFIIGVKLFIETLELPRVNFHSASNPAFWIFWGLMGLGILYGFKPRRR
jgi:YkoY family integral membrane protein